jgi:hypothetical protein
MTVMLAPEDVLDTVLVVAFLPHRSGLDVLDCVAMQVDAMGASEQTCE